MYTHLPEDARSGRQTPELSGKGKPKYTRSEAQKERRRQREAEKRRLAQISRHFQKRASSELDFRDPMMQSA